MFQTTRRNLSEYNRLTNCCSIVASVSCPHAALLIKITKLPTKETNLSIFKIWRSFIKKFCSANCNKIYVSHKIYSRFESPLADRALARYAGYCEISRTRVYDKLVLTNT